MLVLFDWGRGISGGLYPDGTNLMPRQHVQVGLERATRIQPLDRKGNPTEYGMYVLLSVGMSNASQEFCGQAVMGISCDPWTLVGQSVFDPEVNYKHLSLVNGADGGQTAETWDSPTDENYDRIRNTLLFPLGLSEKQVQVVWLKVANAIPEVSLPSQEADAYHLLVHLGNIVRALKVRYPNLHQVFVLSRTYGGYANSPLNPEPYAYESGFAVKWFIEAQIRQMQGGPIDKLAGDLNYDTVAPWLAWRPLAHRYGLRIGREAHRRI